MSYVTWHDMATGFGNGAARCMYCSAPVMPLETARTDCSDVRGKHQSWAVRYVFLLIDMACWKWEEITLLAMVLQMSDLRQIAKQIRWWATGTVSPRHLRRLSQPTLCVTAHDDTAALDGYHSHSRHRCVRGGKVFPLKDLLVITVESAKQSW